MLVPELTVDNPSLAAETLGRFGFQGDQGLWRLGNQALRLASGRADGHGRIDHVALSVPDIDQAVAGLTARGLALADVTPAGPELIAEFWDAGLRFVYMAGPEGARIELCQRIAGPAPAPGHDHVGIPCSDLAAMQAFFESHGGRPSAAFDLVRPEGRIAVRFLSFHGGMIELFQPPRSARFDHGHWSRLLIPDLAAPIHGPEGLMLAPL